MQTQMPSTLPIMLNHVCTCGIGNRERLKFRSPESSIGKLPPQALLPTHAHEEVHNDCPAKPCPSNVCERGLWTHDGSSSES
eukprot:5124214-Amphidinium_carterae.1